MPPPESDAILVKNALNNPENFGHIVELFEAPVSRYLYRLTGASHEEWEDLLQEVFIKAYRHLNSFDTRLKLSSWIYRIAHNVAIDWRRKSQKNILSLDTEDEQHQSLIEKIASDDDIQINIVQEEQRILLKKLLTSLPAYHSYVLLLYYLENKSYEEISDILQIPINTVGTLLFRAKEQCRKLGNTPAFSSHFSHEIN